VPEADQHYSDLPGGSARPLADQPPADCPQAAPQPPLPRERQRFRSRGELVAGALAGLLIGLVLLVLAPKEVALALRLEGTPGTLRIASCIQQPDGHSVDYACTGDFRSTGGGGTFNLPRASYTSADNLTGRTISVQRGPNGGYYTVSRASAAQWAGFLCFGLCLIGIFLMFLPSFSSRVDYRIRPSVQAGSGMLNPAQRWSVRIGIKVTLLALLGSVLCEAAALVLAMV
jgi:hypothetical protein